MLRPSFCRVRDTLFLALALLLPIAALSADNTNTFFPLMAWNSPPPDQQTLQRMRDCGLTVAGFVAPKDLDLCHRAGLKAIVSDPRVSNYDWTSVNEPEARKNVSALVAEVGNHPAVYGYYLRDEPGASFFPGLATVSAILRELAPGKWPYINLFPNYASKDQLGTGNYAEYLDRFIQKCRPPIISYDHYALMDDGTLRNGYWQNLEAMRNASKSNDIPFWNIVLAVAHFNYREPTAADLRFQVYSTLAYGGRGIAYFTYFAPQIGNYRMAPVDQFGHETPTWDSLRNVNLQVAQLAPTLLALRSDRVYHFGSIPENCSAPAADSLVSQIAGPFAVGDFTHPDGSQYVMVVNKDVVKSHYCNPIFREGSKQLQMVSPYTGRQISFSGEQKWLAPGQGVLLKLP